jgi:hypothetical protein
MKYFNKSADFNYSNGILEHANKLEKGKTKNQSSRNHQITEIQI